MRHNEYTEIADNFCKKHSITVKFTYTGLATNTNWDDCIPRPRYRYDIKTSLGHMWGIFWDSIANKEKLLSKDPKKIAEAEPTAYDILTCLGGDVYAGDVDFDEFCSEYGYDNTPGSERTKARRIWKACLKQNEKLRRCFTKEQIEEMCDTIQ